MTFRNTIVPQYWWVLAVVITVLCSGLYAVGQQVMRQSANDPQIQIAEDIAYGLAHGGDIHSLIGPSNVEMAQSLAPFTIVYNDKYEMVASNVRDAQIPVIPRGVLEYTNQYSVHRVTWQPAPALRIAAVLQKVEGAQGGFVLVGRSLREVEDRSDGLFRNVVAGWLATLVISLLVAVGLHKRKKVEQKAHKA